MPLTLTTLPDTVEAGLYTDRAIGPFKRRLDQFVASAAPPLPRFAGGNSAERVAFAAFQAYVRFIESSNFVYSFTQVGVPWDGDAWLTGNLRGNCMNLALGFNYLLQHLGFPTALLGLQQSYPSNPNIGKISQKASERLSAADVRGVARFEGAWDYASIPYPQSRIGATNTLVIRRGAWFPGRHYEDQVVSKSHRDVFDNHWCSRLKLHGVPHPFFDPLVGARYRNGQEDMFESFLRIGHLTYKEFRDNPVYRCTDNMQALLYAIPPRFHDVTGNAIYRSMAAASRAAANDDPDVRMFWRIDPGLDWFDRNTGPRVVPEDARPHPLFVQQLFHMCSVSRWTGSVSYGTGRTQLQQP